MTTNEELLGCPSLDELEKLCQDWVITPKGDMVTNGVVTNCKVAILAANALLKIMKGDTRPAKTEWIPISEAPKDEHTVFLIGGKGRTPYIVVNTSRSYVDKDNYPYHSYLACIPISARGITHWMPLPQPPEE